MGNYTMRALALSLLLALTACGGGGGGPPPSGPYPGRLAPDIGWAAYGTASGLIERLPNPFNFPSQGRSINYVYTLPQGLALGKTIALDYTLVGDGALGVADSSDQPPATMRLFIWGAQADTGNDRWWCPKVVNLAIGEGQLQCVIDQSWTGVTGQPTNQAFTAAVGGPFAVGFTFGGQNFAGHGVWATSGTMTFKVNNWSVQ